MAEVLPRRNLPDDAEQWGRSLETMTVNLRSDLTSVQQSLQGQNRNTASSLAVIGAQVEAIERTQAELEAQQEALAAQQAALAAQQASIVATQTFLSTQTVAESKGTLDQFTGNPGSISWFGFDGTYDCAVAVTTGSAGRLVIQASATLLSSGLTSVLGIEVDGVVGPSYPGPFSTYQSDTAASSSGVARIVVVNVAPNTAYIVRTRRGASGSSGTAMWRDQSLVVTRS